MNIKEYFNMDDPAYSEYEIYRWFKHTYRWKFTVLEVRLHELFYLVFPLLYKIIKYPQDLVNLVNKWED